MEALRKGFEPLRGLRHNSSQGCRRGPLGYLSIFQKGRLNSLYIDINLILMDRIVSMIKI